jgi:glucosamine-6-phosphate deaminase
MILIRAKDYNDMSRKAGNILSAQLILNPRSVLGLATGDSPKGVYQHLINGYRSGDLDFSGVTTVNLDEYKGLAPDHPQSYRYFMEKNIFSGINIKPENTYLPNGISADDQEECRRYDEIIRQKGIDLQVLGFGNNGHIGFNEPSGFFAAGTNVVDLTPSTIDANKRFFEHEKDVPRQAFTMGIQTIMQARRIVVVVSGEGKAGIVRACVQGPITPEVPGSVLQLHSNVTLVGDEAALSLIK